jgi:hypothetical protein
MGTTVSVANLKQAEIKAPTASRLLELYARVALAAGFLSSVADRFGLWGPPGSPRAAWGNWANFVKYTAVLNFFVPHSLAPVFGGRRDHRGKRVGVAAADLMA